MPEVIHRYPSQILSPWLGDKVDYGCRTGPPAYVAYAGIFKQSMGLGTE